MSMVIRPDNNLQSFIDSPLVVKCPHCGVVSNITPISIPRYELLARFRPSKVGIAYLCNACKGVVFLRFQVKYDLGNRRIFIFGTPEEVERPQETFEFQYLPKSVADDFKEALVCYSNGAYNAFGAMCRRTIQSAFQNLGVGGKDRVMDQLKEIRKSVDIDNETYDLIKQIIIAGHDGAHPHLPPLTQQRAVILLEFMKDVLYQLFVRKQKIQEAIKLRQEEIIQRKEDLSET